MQFTAEKNQDIPRALARKVPIIPGKRRKTSHAQLKNHFLEPLDGGQTTDKISSVRNRLLYVSERERTSARRQKSTWE